MKTEVNKRLDGLIFYEQGKGYNGYSVNIASLAGKSMDGGRQDLLFDRFSRDVVNAGNGIANLNCFDGFLAELTGTGTSKLYYM